MNNNIPIYNAILEDEEHGIFTISLVPNPATQVEMICFNEDKPIQKFAVQSEEKRLVYSVVMIADTPIYRRDDDGYEYYVVFTADSIAKMAEKMLKDNTQNIFSLYHNGVILDENAISMRETFIIDREKGINPTFFENVPNGSLVASLHINDDELWEECKEGKFGGISIEVFVNLYKQEEQFNNNKKNNITKMSKIKDLFKKLLTAFGAVATDKGTVHYDGDGELVEGMEVFNEDGEVLADGDYTTEDGKVIKVADGKVTEIVDVEAEVADEEVKEEMEEETVEEVVEPETVEEPEYDAKAEIEELKAQIEGIKKTLEELIATPATEPIEEEFSKKQQVENKYQKLGEAMRQLK